MDNVNLPSNIAQFKSFWVTQSHIEIVQTLKILERDIDNESNDELNILNQAMHCSNWPK